MRGAGFEEASSINFRRSVVYRLGTLLTLVKFMLHRAGLWGQPQFSRPLREVMSRYHWGEIEQAEPRRDFGG